MSLPHRFVAGLLPVLLVSSLELSPLHAAGPIPAAPAEDDSILLPEVLVTAETPDQKKVSLTSPSYYDARQEGRGIPGGYTIKTVDEFQVRGGADFQNLLQNTPGVYLQNNSSGEVSKISIRGSGIQSDDEPLGVQFLLDGVPYNEGDGEVLLEDFDLGSIRYAQVYRGANAYKYGSYTLGGAVNLVSQTGYDADPFTVRLEGGSFGTVKGWMGSGGVCGDWDYFATFMGRSRDGYRVHSQEEQERFNANVGYRINDELENRFYMTIGALDRNTPGGQTKGEIYNNPASAEPDAVTQDFGQQWHAVRLTDKVAWKTENNEADAAFFWAYRDRTEKEFWDPDFQQGINGFTSNNFGLPLDWTNTTELFGDHKNVFTAGYRPTYEVENDTNYVNNNGSKGAITARGQNEGINMPLVAENQFFITEKLSLVTAFQFIFARRNFTDEFTVDGNASNSQNFYGYNPKVGVIYDIDEESQAYVNFSRSWQPPSFDNMVGFTEGPGSHVEYTPLQPQTAWTVETGARGETGRFDWELSLYHSWVRNELLELNDALGNHLGAVNAAKSMHQGIEAGLGYHLLDSYDEAGALDSKKDDLILNQSFTLNNFQFEDNPVYGNNEIAGIPIYLYQMDLTYHMANGFYAGTNIQWNMSSYYVDEANTLSANPYGILGFKIGYASQKGWTVYFEVQNATDQRYASSVEPIADATTDSNPMIFQSGDGRAFYGGMSYAF
jgi:iron complex outermembrane receptor protein